MLFRSEHAAEWHYYMGRLCHMRYNFDEARVHLRMALDMEDNQEAWVDDAKLRYGQCDNQSNFPEQYVLLESKEALISHSKDFFRLYEMPVSEGRLGQIPAAGVQDSFRLTRCPRRIEDEERMLGVKRFGCVVG